jgi:hypothetical protein
VQASAGRSHFRVEELLQLTTPIALQRQAQAPKSRQRPRRFMRHFPFLIDLLQGALAFVDQYLAWGEDRVCFRMGRPLRSVKFLTPTELPGTGQQLLLQSQTPVCLTREVRRAPDEEMIWPECPPRVLFAAAAPSSVGDIPLEAHLLALRRALQPWVKYYDANDPVMRAKRLGEHFAFLPEASIEAIEAQCASSNFTHVHILAHGIKVNEGHDTRYALALHSARNPHNEDAITGALRASERCGRYGLARPAVVTLASCDAANVGSVAGAGSSIAHALHEAGIPMVVAGQFPLSFAGLGSPSRSAIRGAIVGPRSPAPN